jgi:UDP-N-acetylmuramate--alanine ligase
MTELDWSRRRLHFIAIGGAGMSGLALVCHRLGARVSGSDRAESGYLARLREAGLEPRIGHDADAVPADAEVVVSTAIADDNPELARARKRGQTVLHRGQLLAELCAQGRLIAVAGTHGKTTTTGMLVHALQRMGADPAFFVGGELPGAGPDGGAANAGWGKGSDERRTSRNQVGPPGEGDFWVIAEADESDGSFLDLRPEIAVVTNVELDHHARWSSRAELTEAFAKFAAGARGLALGAGAELPIASPSQALLRFDDDAPGPPDLDLGVPGRHNVLNARAALAALELAGFDAGRAAEALAGFPGMLRRQELKGEVDGALVYDDYAHHPTEVRATLEAMRELQPKRIVAVFQPHLFSRTKALAEDFGAALSGADEVGVLDVYSAREEPVGPLAGVSGLLVARAAADRSGGKPVLWLRDRATAAAVLRSRIRDGDLVITIGAGDVNLLADELTRTASAPETKPRSRGV